MLHSVRAKKIFLRPTVACLFAPPSERQNVFSVEFAQTTGNRHSLALAQGIRAMEEAKDFSASSSVASAQKRYEFLVRPRNLNFVESSFFPTGVTGLTVTPLCVLANWGKIATNMNCSTSK